jgi:hypothetical protein
MTGSGGGTGGAGGWDPSLDESCGLCGPGDVLVNSVCPGACTGCPAPPRGGVMACVGTVCTPRCPAGYTLCGDTCSKLATSLDDCGSCGAACPTGLCVGGVCNASLSRVLVSTADFNELALDATTVFYADKGGGTIGRVAKTGGATTTLASGETSVAGLAVDADHVYWSTAAGSIKRVPKAGGVVQVVSTGKQPGPVAVDGASVFWSAVSAGPLGEDQVQSAPVTGGTAAVVYDETNNSATPPVQDLLLDGPYVYFLTPSDFAGYVKRALKDGSGTPDLLMTGPSPNLSGAGSTLAVDQDYVYAGDDSLAGIMRRRKDLTGAKRAVVSLGASQLDALAVGDLYVYFTRGLGVPNAGKALKCGGHPVYAVSPFPMVGPYGTPLVLDGAYVYTVFQKQLLRLPQ